MEESRNSLPTSSLELYQSLEQYSDVPAYLNELLDTKDSTEAKETIEVSGELLALEKHVTRLSALFELACEDTSAHVERTIEEISRNVPRLTYDLQLMRQSALSLQFALNSIDDGSKRANDVDETTQALERLYYLDRVKTNMDASLVVLKEAEAWSTLESEVIGYLTEEAHARAAARLSEASKSLIVFQNTPEYEPRKTLLTALQNQLEVSLSAALVTGINKRDTEACKTFFEIFRSIERETEFRSYWYGSKKKAIVELWDAAKIADCDDTIKPEVAKHRELVVFLSEFFGQLLSLLDAERTAIVSIFPNAQLTVSEFISSVFVSLHPTFTERLGSLAAKHGNQALPKLVNVFKETERFANEVDKLMEKIVYSTANLSKEVSSNVRHESDASYSSTNSRRLSRTPSRRAHRFSSSFSFPSNSQNVKGGPLNTLRESGWEDSLFEPFLHFQLDYGSFERAYLKEKLQYLSSMTEHSLNSARKFRERSVDIFSMADDALQRCMAFTHGYGMIGLIQALDETLESFIDSSENLLTPFKSSPVEEMENSGLKLDADLAELDYSPRDYEAFQLALHLLDAARGILERISVLEAKLRADLLHISGVFKLMKNDPLGLYISGTTRGAITFLQGSILNSAELNRLLEAADPDQQTSSHPLNSPLPTATLPAIQETEFTFSPLLRRGRAAVAVSAGKCQSFLQKTILSPLFRYLSPYPLLPMWTTADAAKQKTPANTVFGGMSEIVLPSFSLSPSQIVQRVAEGILNLPRLIEVYADDDALAFSIETLPFIEKISSNIFNSEEDNSDSLVGRKDENGRHVRRLSSATAPMKWQGAQGLAMTSTIVWTPELVSSAWLASLSLSLVLHLTSNSLPKIRALTSTGAAQLLEDLNYLSQIIKALNVECEELEKWKAGLQMEEVEFRQMLLNDKSVADGEIVVLIAKMRGFL